MFPPATFSRDSFSRSNLSVGVAAGKARRQIAARRSVSGNRNWTTKRSRYRKPVSSALLCNTFHFPFVLRQIEQIFRPGVITRLFGHRSVNRALPELLSCELRAERGVP
jgi:hypothetical protein